MLTHVDVSCWLYTQWMCWTTRNISLFHCTCKLLGVWWNKRSDYKVDSDEQILQPLILQAPAITYCPFFQKGRGSLLFQSICLRGIYRFLDSRRPTLLSFTVYHSSSVTLFSLVLAFFYSDVINHHFVVLWLLRLWSLSMTNPMYRHSHTFVTYKVWTLHCNSWHSLDLRITR
jgi:hypothetical protein